MRGLARKLAPGSVSHPVAVMDFTGADEGYQVDFGVWARGIGAYSY